MGKACDALTGPDASGNRAAVSRWKAGRRHESRRTRRERSESRPSQGSAAKASFPITKGARLGFGSASKLAPAPTPPLGPSQGPRGRTGRRAPTRRSSDRPSSVWSSRQRVGHRPFPPGSARPALCHPTNDRPTVAGPTASAYFERIGRARIGAFGLPAARLLPPRLRLGLSFGPGLARSIRDRTRAQTNSTAAQALTTFTEVDYLNTTQVSLLLLAAAFC